MRIFNQYSFLAAAVFLIGLIAVLAYRARARQGAYLVLALVVLAIMVAWYFLRPTPTPDTAGIQAQIGSGVPVLLEFQSPY